jgi:hypothetical protein
MDLNFIYRFFELYYILAEKQWTNPTYSSSLNFCTFLDTQDNLKCGIIVEWKKLWAEILVWTSLLFKMADKLRPEDLQAFKGAFDMFDKNQDGTISTKVSNVFPLIRPLLE